MTTMAWGSFYGRHMHRHRRLWMGMGTGTGMGMGMGTADDTGYRFKFGVRLTTLSTGKNNWHSRFKLSFAIPSGCLQRFFFNSATPYTPYGGDSRDFEGCPDKKEYIVHRLTFTIPFSSRNLVLVLVLVLVRLINYLPPTPYVVFSCTVLYGVTIALTILLLRTLYFVLRTLYAEAEGEGEGLCHVFLSTSYLN